MSTFNKFEDITAWQKARELCQMVYKLTNQPQFSRDFTLKDQIRRSSGSTMDNIAEGFCRNGSAEFRQFLSIAKASSAEVQSQLYRALDFEYINQSQFEEGYTKANNIIKMITGLMKYLNQTKYKGTKFKK